MEELIRCATWIVFLSSALQPNLLSFPQQQGSLLLSQPGPSLASQVTCLSLCSCPEKHSSARSAASLGEDGRANCVSFSSPGSVHLSLLLSEQAVGRSGLPGSSVEPHLDVPQHLQVAKHLTPSGASEEPSDLEELEKFAKTFKQRRIKLGFTQVSILVHGSAEVTAGRNHRVGTDPKRSLSISPLPEQDHTIQFMSLSLVRPPY